MVDVTIGGDKVKGRKWKYLIEESRPDHPYLQFKLELENNSRSVPTRNVYQS